MMNILCIFAVTAAGDTHGIVSAAAHRTTKNNRKNNGKEHECHGPAAVV